MRQLVQESSKKRPLQPEPGFSEFRLPKPVFRLEFSRVTGLVFSLAFVFSGLIGSDVNGQPTMEATRIASGLARPVFVTAAPGDTTRLFIVEQRSGSTGRIRVYNVTTNTLLATPFLSINNVATGSEQGLLGLAFHPNYQTNGRFYVNYNNAAGTTVIAEYQRSTPDVANPASARTLLTIAQPFSNHNGGWMGFGPTDNYLYISSGDGGSGGDPGNNAQTITGNLLGKILRIDPLGNNSSNGQYGNPPTNPFVGVAGDDEIWCYGLRNPWRCSFDYVTGDLFIGDVGQNLLEEIDVQPGGTPGGQNYGWRVREGTSGPPLAGAIDPIYVYTRGAGGNQGFSVTGGYVYRGPIRILQGRYFFGDYVNDTVWSLNWTGTPPAANNGANFTDFINWSPQITALPAGAAVADVSSFGEDLLGNLYVCDLGGEVFRITDATIPINILETKFLDGSVGSGTLANVNTRDNTYMRLNPATVTNLRKQKVVVAADGIARSATPGRISFRLEARMTGGPASDVIQKIFAQNQVTGAWELIDSRPTSNTDFSIDAQFSGDLTRFINPKTNEMRVILQWASESFTGAPFTWFVEVDEAVWSRAE
jgi:Glucose / Sorbosone dehydrogenase